MMTNPTLRPVSHQHQSGAVMVISLIMLLLLTLIGVTGSQMTGLEEKMSGNMRDRNIAFQAAEVALRDAERDLSSTVAIPPRRIITGLTGFTEACSADGLCTRGSTGPYVTPIWKTADMQAAPSVAYGRFSGAAPIPGLSTQPRYLIEGLRAHPPGCSTSVGGIPYYSITVRAQGINPNTVVWLQSVFKKPDKTCWYD